ncbi:MAG: bifunctional DNA primase/polymerase, partial [Planctomycetota bacterium]
RTALHRSVLPGHVWNGHAEILRFLDDLTYMSIELGLIIAGIGRGTDNWCSLPRLASLARNDATGRRKLDNLHIRIYAKADCFARWNQLFQWDANPGAIVQGNQAGKDADVVERLRELLHSDGLQQQRVAAQLKVSKQYMSTVLNGKKRCSDKLKLKIEKFLARHTKPSPSRTARPVEKPQFELVDVQVKEGSTAMQKAALDYYDRGMCVIPIRSWEVSRRPYVKWKQYQAKRPTRQQVIDWWTGWPDAGIAVILGPVSNLLCVDADGEQAHRILLELVGEIPLTPTCKSGSADPFRYHLYFQHPKQLTTAASKTPFNEPDDKGKLELRGETGLLVLPPSLHKSGRRYAWVRGRSLDDVELPELPDVLLEALEAASKSLVDDTEPDALPATATKDTKANSHTVEFGGYHVSPSTARFLSGEHAESMGWNLRLFRAACDLNARGVPFAKAEKLLLQGAKPKSSADERAARDTITSAYSESREPSRF